METAFYLFLAVSAFGIGVLVGLSMAFIARQRRHANALISREYASSRGVNVFDNMYRDFDMNGAETNPENARIAS